MVSHDFVSISKSIIKQYQSDNGAFVACPNFDTYNYCWLRDGTFIAYALDVHGEHEAALRFYRWVHLAIIGQKSHLYKLNQKDKLGERLSPKDFLPARYTLEGKVAEDEWPNFQLDGYGTWIWGLGEHIARTGNTGLAEEFAESLNLTYDYLSRFWGVSNYDCWEEFGDRVHPATLACLYGGAEAAGRLTGDGQWSELAGTIRSFILSEGTADGRFVKSIGYGNVDASLLWLGVPFRVVEPGDPVMVNTVKAIEAKLLHDGGVHRYPEDTYYGGGEWLLLSCWLGWYYSLTDQTAAAQRQLEWTERQADGKGEMTEQVLHHVNKPEKIGEWQNLWGEVAKPLLWSHAMYLVLSDALQAETY